MAKKITNPVTGNTYKVSGDKNKASTYQAFEANATNYKMFTEQNDWNLNMYNQQRLDAQSDWERDTAYNEKMLAEQRVYDSPSAQRQRLIEAGYNPLTIGGSSFGGGSGSSLEAPQENTPDAPASANWAGATMPDITQSKFDIVGQVLGALDDMVGTFKQGVEAFELPQYVFNDTQRAASENALRNMMLRKMYVESPNWLEQQTADINYKKADTLAKSMVAEREKATKEYIDEQTKWLPDISASQIDKACSEYALNWKQVESISKNIDVADENIRFIAQEIAESTSRAAVNWASAKGQRLHNDLVEKYGERETELGIQAYEDAHNQALAETLFQSLSIKKEDRGLWLEALGRAGIYTEDELRDFLDTIRLIKDGAVLSPRQEQRWYEPIAALVPALAAAGYLGKSVIGAMSKGVAPVVLPSTNIYGQPVFNRSWGSRSLMN